MRFALPRMEPRGLLCLVALLAGLSAAAGTVRTDFEHTVPVAETDSVLSNMKRAGWTFDEPLRLPPGWRPNPGVSKNGEYRLIADRTRARTGEHCIYLRGHLMMHRPAVEVAAGDEFELRFFARDPAGKSVAAVLYTYRRDEQGKYRFIATIPFLTSPVGPDWTECAELKTIPETVGEERVNAVISVLVSNTGAFFDDVELVHTRTTAYQNAEDALHAGGKYLEQDRYALAHEAFAKALDLATTLRARVESLSRIAETHRKEKRYADALAALNNLLQIEGLDRDTALTVRHQIADLYTVAGRHAEAGNALRDMLDMTPSDARARVDLLLRISECHRQAREYAEMANVLEQVLTMPQADCLTKVATLFRIAAARGAAGERDREREQYRELLAMPAVSYADEFAVWRQIGHTFRTEGRLEEAREAYKKALSVPDVNPYSAANAIIAIGDTFRDEKRFAEAREAYAELAGTDTVAWLSRVLAYIRIGETYHREQAYGQEREQYAAMLAFVRGRQRLSATDIGRVEADMLRLTGDSFWAEGREHEATEYYIRWQEMDPAFRKSADQQHVQARVGLNDTAAYLARGRNLLAQGKHADALEQFARAAEAGESTARQKAEARMRAADGLLDLREPAKAKRELEAALHLQGAGPHTIATVRMRLGDGWAGTGNHAEARAAYAQILAIPEVPVAAQTEARMMIAALLRAEHRFEEARQQYYAILKLDGLSPEHSEQTTQKLRTIYR